MTLALEPVQDIDTAWASAVRSAIDLPNGRAVHLLITVTSALPAALDLAPAIDALLSAKDEYSVGTVASTIFPVELYRPPAFGFTHGLAAPALEELDAAAAALYNAYRQALPSLLTASGNSMGTYFQRMISYGDREGGGFNQLQERIKSLRAMTAPNERTKGRGTGNFFNLDLAGDGAGESAGAAGLQLLDPRGRKERGFPCLVHIDLTVVDRRLHLLAVYRRQNLITKGYGNLLGLARLQAFICQQSGLALGDLAVLAAFADAEEQHYGKRAIRALLDEAEQQRARP